MDTGEGHRDSLDPGGDGVPPVDRASMGPLFSQALIHLEAAAGELSRDHADPALSARFSRAKSWFRHLDRGAVGFQGEPNDGHAAPDGVASAFLVDLFLTVATLQGKTPPADRLDSGLVRLARRIIESHVELLSDPDGDSRDTTPPAL